MPLLMIVAKQCPGQEVRLLNKNYVFACNFLSLEKFANCSLIQIERHSHCFYQNFPLVGNFPLVVGNFPPVKNHCAREITKLGKVLG